MNPNEAKLMRMIAETFELEESEIHTRLRMGDVEGWDSMGQIMLMAEIEEQFHVSFDTEQILTLTSVQLIWNELQHKLAKKAG